MRSITCATAARLRSSPASSTPVPRPTHVAGSPPSRRAASAAATVVLPIPISPITSRSVSSASTAATAASTTSSKRSRRHRRLVADVAGRVADADVDRVERRPDRPRQRADRRPALAAGVEHRRRDGGRVGADARRATATPWSPANTSAGGSLDPRRRQCAAMPPCGRRRRRAAPARPLGAGCRRRGRARRRPTSRPVRAAACSASCSHVIGAARADRAAASARPATMNRARSAAGDPSLG